MKKIDAFILYSEPDKALKTVTELQKSDFINKIYLLTPEDVKETIKGCINIEIDTFQSSNTIKKIAEKTKADYTIIYNKPTPLKLGYFALERMMQIAEDSSAGMVYSDYFAIVCGEKKNYPVLDYQEGSLRDDFNFGSLILFNSIDLKKAAKRMANNEYKFAGFYDLRLKVSQKASLVHINEYLYTEHEEDTRDSGKKIFDYVDPKNRQVQIEMEQACTQHLKNVGAYLEPSFKPVEFNKINFEYEASVIIPVRNRIKTIKDAISSVLRQKNRFQI